MTEPEQRDPAAAADSLKRDLLTEDSDDLLAAIESIHRLEDEKRREPMSSPGFHDRAIRIERLARRVFGLARSQREVGEMLSAQQDTSIEEESADRERR